MLNKIITLFYQEFIMPPNFSKEIYKEYNRENQLLVQKYGLEIPEEIREYVKFREDKT